MSHSGEQKTKKVRIVPGWRQYLAQNLFWALLIVILAVAILVLQVSSQARGFMLVVFALLVLMQCAEFIRMSAFKWVIDDEQIQRTMGVFSRTTDYVELYRVTDYIEVQTFLQRIFKVKSLVVVSTDKTDSMLPILGIPEKIDLKEYIRKKVEYCKQIHNIYEITNR